MFNDQKLWKDRVGRRGKDLGRYLRYIFNGHLVVVLLFLIGSGAFYYQAWIKTLSSGFPVEIIMAICIGLCLTYSPVYNFLFEADRIFLLPLETRMQSYFLRSGVVSLIFQGYILLLVLAVLMPLYAGVSGSGFGSFLPFFISLLILKAWNLAASWRVQYFVQNTILVSDGILRFILNGLFSFVLFKHAHYLFLILLVLAMVFYYWTLYVRTRSNGLKWDSLINKEEKRMNSFYRLANLFTDVPNLKETVKRRKWLDLFVNQIHFTQASTYLYLYTRTFLRSGDYLGLSIRLSVIGILALYFLSFGIGQIIIALLFLYLTGFQLLPLWNHHQNKLWVDLYPVPIKYKYKAFYTLLMVVLSVQSVLFFLFILIKGNMIYAVSELVIGIAFSTVFVFLYSKTRLKA